MGCISPDRLKQHEELSNREVNPQSENPRLHHGLSTLACGYQFNFDHQELGQILEKSKRAQLREQQMDLYEQFDQDYLQLGRLYKKEHNLDLCMPLVTQLESTLEKINFEAIDISPQEVQEVKNMFEEVRVAYNEMDKFAKSLDLSLWKGLGQKNGINMYSRREDGTVGILMEAIVEVPVEIFLTVISELDFFSELIPDIKVSREQKYIQRNHKIGYCLFDLPILSMREAVFEGVGYNRLEHNNTIFIYSQSIHNRQDICRRLDFSPTLNPSYVQIDYRYLCIKYEPLAVGRGKATIAMNIDMKLNFVPLWILQLVCKKFCNDFLQEVMDVSKRFPGSKWEQKVKRQPQSYQFFRDIMKQYYQRHGMI